MESKKEKWIKTIRAWEKSGLKRIDFCRQNQIVVSTFDYWRVKVRKEAGKSSKQNLVKLPALIKPARSSSFTLEYPSGPKIQIPDNYSSESLKRLVLDMNEVLG